MAVLDRKLLRDLWALRGQALAIALVIAGGVATYVMAANTMHALRTSRAIYYRDYRFADVFCTLRRAPEKLRGRIAALPGVQAVETRVVGFATLDVAGYSDPVMGQFVSLPDRGEPVLNRLYLRKGRWVDPLQDDEVLVHEAFAEAHRLQPGDSFWATMRGKRRRLRVAGIALSPEFIYAVQPGAVIPDFRAFGVFWMRRKALAHAYELEGSFNDLVIRLSPGANAREVIDRLDSLLTPYGGLGAYERTDQVSHRYLTEEFHQLENMARIFPAIVIAVAAFLLNVVVGRLIATQREQIAILKAFGYRNRVIVLHYVKFVCIIVALGTSVGVALGLRLGRGLSNLYMEFYRLPFLLYSAQPGPILIAAAASAAAALLATIATVIRAASLPPAQAMQPPAPAKYRQSILERFGLGRWLAPPSRMILRNLERRPLKAALSMIGIASACSILIVGGFFDDAIDYLVHVQFRLGRRDDLALTFIDPTSRRAAFDLRRLPGVEWVEPFRSVPVRMRSEHRSYRTYIRGISEPSSLYLLLDRQLRELRPPEEGVLLTDHLAKILRVSPGEWVTVEVLEGERPVRRVPVAGLVREWVGVAGYMKLGALNRLLREGPTITGALLLVDEAQAREVNERLKQIPRVAATGAREKALRNFYETMADQLLIFAFFNTLLASVIVFGVVYNSARIAFSERARELATLRVLGFTRGEVSYILLGELALLTLLALPLGFLLGRLLCAYLVTTLPTDLYRVPLVINPSTYAMAASVVLASSMISAWTVRYKLDRLDLVAVLKTKE